MRPVRRYRGRVVEHRSGFEDKIIQNLKDRGVDFAYEEKTFIYQRPVRRASCSDCGSNAVSVQRRYTPDIYLKASNTYVEAKGKFTAENRSAMEDFLKGAPGVDLRFLFQRDNWITKKQKSKYSDWADKHGVKYHIGSEIPEEWTQTQNK